METILLHDAFQRAAAVAGEILTPLLLALLVVGLVVSVVQVVVQLNDVTLTFVPKLIVLFGLLYLLGGRFVGWLVQFVHELWRFEL